MSAHAVLAVSEKLPPSKALNITLWIVQVLAAAMFCIAGGTKLAGADMQIALFEQIGLGQWFRYVTGGLEVLCAILLLVPSDQGRVVTSAVGDGDRSSTS